MDQQQYGNFIAFKNRSKEQGDNKPTFDGRLAVPGSQDETSDGLVGRTSTRDRRDADHVQRAEPMVLRLVRAPWSKLPR